MRLTTEYTDQVFNLRHHVSFNRLLWQDILMAIENLSFRQGILISIYEEFRQNMAG